MPALRKWLGIPAPHVGKAWRTLAGRGLATCWGRQGGCGAGRLPLEGSCALRPCLPSQREGAASAPGLCSPAPRGRGSSAVAPPEQRHPPSLPRGQGGARAVRTPGGSGFSAPTGTAQGVSAPLGPGHRHPVLPPPSSPPPRRGQRPGPGAPPGQGLGATRRCARGRRRGFHNRAEHLCPGLQHAATRGRRGVGLGDPSREAAFLPERRFTG